jgi:tRNA threonylcarbamoyladenosine biosynthesis protein TsaE
MSSEPVQFSAFLQDEAATLAVGARLAAVLRPGLYIALSGDLGAGKTTLARGVLRGLGYGGKVKSPTYTLVEVYKLSRLDFYHFDLYRFNDPQEWWDAGFQEHFGGGNVCLVEWAERAKGLLPAPDMNVALRAEREGRRLEVEANTETGRHCLELLQF